MVKILKTPQNPPNALLRVKSVSRQLAKCITTVSEGGRQTARSIVYLQNYISHCRVVGLRTAEGVRQLARWFSDVEGGVGRILWGF
jgi:hypothetical protein